MSTPKKYPPNWILTPLKRVVTVQNLIDALSKLPNKKMPVILALDDDGNGFLPLSYGTIEEGDSPAQDCVTEALEMHPEIQHLILWP